MKNILFLFVIIIYSNCSKKQNGIDLNEQFIWYQNTKKVIIKHSNLKYDRICTQCYGDGKYKDVHYFNNDRQFQVNEYKDNKLSTIRKYSMNNTFELRIKFYPNSNKESEGILYHGLYYGIYKKWYENGMLKEFGVKYMNNYVGKYKYWSSSYKCTEIITSNDENIDLPNLY